MSEGIQLSQSALVEFIAAAFPSVVQSSCSLDEVAGLSHSLYPAVAYSHEEENEISEWVRRSSAFVLVNTENNKAFVDQLQLLDSHLATHTTLLGWKPSTADLAMYQRLAPIVKSWSLIERTRLGGYQHIVRYMAFVQGAPQFGLRLSTEAQLEINLDATCVVDRSTSSKSGKDRKNNENKTKLNSLLDADKGLSDEAQTLNIGESSQTSAARIIPNDMTESKKKKGTKSKSAASPAVAPPLSPSLIDLRVGQILQAIAHPDADSLYVSSIACGDAVGTENTSNLNGQTVRTVCSGLNGLIPLPDMQGRKVVVVCNLKPVKMRGILSSAMVLAASPAPMQESTAGDMRVVELIDPPATAVAGERCMFDGWHGKCEGILNPKKKIFESLQPGFRTDQDGRCGFDSTKIETLQSASSFGVLKTESGGTCCVQTLRNALVK